MNNPFLLLSFQVNLKGCEVTPEINLSQHKYQIKLEIPSTEGMTEMWLRLSSVRVCFFGGSLHCSFSLFFCSYSYNGVCFYGLKFSVNDLNVSQKSYNENGKLRFFGRECNFTCTFCAKLWHQWRLFWFINFLFGCSILTNLLKSNLTDTLITLLHNKKLPAN